MCETPVVRYQLNKYLQIVTQLGNDKRQSTSLCSNIIEHSFQDNNSWCWTTKVSCCLLYQLQPCLIGHLLKENEGKEVIMSCNVAMNARRQSLVEVG